LQLIAQLYIGAGQDLVCQGWDVDSAIALAGYPKSVALQGKISIGIKYISIQYLELREDCKEALKEAIVILSSLLIVRAVIIALN